MIKVLKIRINNYKSIYDSKEIIIYDRITTLAGKNESGKTNILKALDTYYNDSFTEEDIPTKDDVLNPTISVDFAIDGDSFNNKLNRKWLDTSIEYTYAIKRSKNIKDEFSGRLCNEIQKKLKEEIINISDDNLKTLLRELVLLILPEYLITDEEIIKIIYEIYSNFIMDGDIIKNIVKAFIKSHFNITGNIKPEIEEKLDEISDYIEKSELFEIVEKIYDIIMPEFKYFDNFDDMLPDEIDISELEDSDFKTKYRGFVNLLGYLNVSLESFSKEMAEVSRLPQTKLDKYSSNITLDYQNIYKQEKLTIALNKDGNKIYVNIYDIDDDINPKKPSQRSKGLQWFLSFYLMLNNSKENAILLIDEPGLYLHASAQEDILKFFENYLTNYIIYTTHSPYLIDTDNMLRIKLVTNDRTKGEGTRVENNYYKCADLDTVTPLITAIGYNMIKSPLEFGGGLNVIVEGVSDRDYILAFLKLVNSMDIVHLIPAKGARVVHLLVSIVIGWNLNYIVFFDNDQAMQDAEKNIKPLFESESDYNEHIFKIIEKEKSCVEDVFSNEDKKKMGIGSKKDKVLVAKNFFDKVQNEEIKLEELSEETQKNIIYIIDIIKKYI